MHLEWFYCMKSHVTLSVTILDLKGFERHLLEGVIIWTAVIIAAFMPYHHLKLESSWFDQRNFSLIQQSFGKLNQLCIVQFVKTNGVCQYLKLMIVCGTSCRERSVADHHTVFQRQRFNSQQNFAKWLIFLTNSINLTTLLTKFFLSCMNQQYMYPSQNSPADVFASQVVWGTCLLIRREWFESQYGQCEWWKCYLFKEFHENKRTVH